METPQVQAGEEIASSREEGLLLGLKKYRTSRPCHKGHLGTRYFSSGHCVECTELKNKIYQKTHLQDILEYNRKWRTANPDKAQEYARRGAAAYRERHPGRYKESLKRYQDKNVELIRERERESYSKNREKRIAKSRRWNIQNADKVAAREAKRRANQRKATPSWVDLKAIEAIYTECARISADTGVKHEVDHIVPLVHRQVQGLHVPWNLEILPATKNQSKGNRFSIG